jgi:Cu/Zn superoxide dismutase
MLMLAGALTLAGCASDASKTPMTAKLSSASEVPQNASAGTGNGTITLDKSSRMLSWKIDYSGLTGEATAAHFHGPASPGANAGVLVPLMNAGKVDNPIVGSAVLTDAQIADLTAGKWYVNIHTKANPGGEIRGQVMPAP